MIKSGSLRRWVEPAVFIVLGFLLYAKVLNGEFVGDDFMVVVDNPAIRNPGDWSALWQAFNSRFLVGLSFALNNYFGGLDPWGFHLVNLGFHLLAVFQVFLLVQTLLETPVLSRTTAYGDRRWLAFYAALIFLCHPVQVQAVAYVTQRAALMGGLCYLSTVILYLRARIRGRNGYFWGAAAAMLAGIFSKEMIVTVPLALTLCEYFFFDGSRDVWRKRAQSLMPFFILAGLLPVLLLLDRPVSVLALKDQFQTGGFSWPHFYTQLNVLRTYGQLLIAPVNLHYLYDYVISTTFWSWPTPGSFLLLGGLAGLSFGLFRRQRLMSFTIPWFFITISVETVVVCVVQRMILFEHWLYLPMAGFAIFVVMGLYQCSSSRAALQKIGVMIVAVLIALTFQRLDVWKTEIGFWEDGMARTPGLPDVYHGAAAAYQRKQRDREALVCYDKGIALAWERNGPGQLSPATRSFLAVMYNDLGALYFRRGLGVQALKAYQAALELDPQPETYHNLGIYLFSSGQYGQAAEQFKRSVELRGGYAQGYQYLGRCYQKLGDCPRSREFLLKARELYRGYRADRKVRQTEEDLRLCDG